MKPAIIKLLAAALLGTGLGSAGMAATAEPLRGAIFVPSGPSNPAKERANKALVADWMHQFWVEDKLDDWAKWMAPDFINHDPREPIRGAQALVDWLKKMTAEHAKKSGKPPMPHVDNDHLIFMADGDLVILAGIPGVKAANYDGSLPVTNISGNIIRIKDGKIAEWWFYGSNNKEVDNYNNMKVLGLAMTPGQPAPAKKADDHPDGY